jgi:hypothetical protein
VIREDTVHITDEGIRYARGVHVVSRRPNLYIISVNSKGEIVHEHRYPTGSADGPASPRVVALIETVEVLNQIERLRATEPWDPVIPFFIPPYETPEAEATAVDYLERLMRKVRGEERNPTERGVHVDVEHNLEGIMVIYAMTSRGERIAERHWDVREDKGQTLNEYRMELERLLAEVDPETE